MELKVEEHTIKEINTLYMCPHSTQAVQSTSSLKHWRTVIQLIPTRQIKRCRKINNLQSKQKYLPTVTRWTATVTIADKEIGLYEYVIKDNEESHYIIPWGRDSLQNGGNSFHTTLVDCLGRLHSKTKNFLLVTIVAER